MKQHEGAAGERTLGEAAAANKTRRTSAETRRKLEKSRPLRADTIDRLVEILYPPRNIAGRPPCPAVFLVFNGAEIARPARATIMRPAGQ